MVAREILVIHCLFDYGRTTEICTEGMTFGHHCYEWMYLTRIGPEVLGEVLTPSGFSHMIRSRTKAIAQS